MPTHTQLKNKANKTIYGKNIGKESFNRSVTTPPKET